MWGKEGPCLQSSDRDLSTPGGVSVLDFQVVWPSGHTPCTPGPLIGPHGPFCTSVDESTHPLRGAPFTTPKGWGPLCFNAPLAVPLMDLMVPPGAKVLGLQVTVTLGARCLSH